jgi:leucyl/phenylalanyl-tRNA---protein transferase
MIPWLGSHTPFPPYEQALTEPNGLLAAGGDLSPRRLLEAYSHGIFPWFNPGEPILWWSPNPRMVLYPGEFRLSRSLARKLTAGRHAIRVDMHFSEVVRACAAPRRGHSGTWISESMMEAYARLHALGHAHCVETWIEGKLAGGLYGVALGRAFFGESMFSTVTDASKIALAHLARQLERWQFGLIDCQMATAHLASLGAREIPRRDFVRQVDNLVHLPGKIGSWKFDHDLFGRAAAQ